MSLALVLIFLGFLLIWAGFKGMHPIDEFRSALGLKK